MAGDTTGQDNGSNNQNTDFKSKKSTVCSLIRFQNRTDRQVDIIWLNYEGARVKYRTLCANDFVDVNTFVGHPWIFIDAESGERLVVELKEVYEPTNGWSVGNPHRKVVNITIPIYSLKDTCFRYFRRTLAIDRIGELEMPEDLKREMRDKFLQHFRGSVGSATHMT